MNPSTNNLMERWTEHRFYTEIVTDITTRNSERKNTQQGNTEKLLKKRYSLYLLANLYKP